MVRYRRATHHRRTVAALVTFLALLVPAGPTAQPAGAVVMNPPVPSDANGEGHAGFADLGRSDITCVTRPTRHDHYFHAYYFMDDGVDRRTFVVPALRTALYGSSALVNYTAARQSPAARRTLKFLCDETGRLVVDVVDTRSMKTIDLGPYQQSPHETAVYVTDDDSGNPWQGGSADLPDPGTEFAGGGGAVQPLGGVGVPMYTMLLHELTHTLGVSHCPDGLDVMCYDDGTELTAGYSMDKCPTVDEYDCGGDTYFNVAPQPGNPILQRWNVGLPANNLYFATSGPYRTVRDVQAPPMITGVTCSEVHGTYMRLSWDPVPDESGMAWYAVTRWFPDPADDSKEIWEDTIKQVRGETVLVTGLTPGVTHHWRIEGWDRAHNFTSSGWATDCTTEPTESDQTPPATPPALTVAPDPRRGDNATVSWGESSDDAALYGYVVELAGPGAPRTVDAPLDDRVVRFDGLRRGTTYTVSVRARDAAGNRSEAAVATLRTPAVPDRTPPQRPSEVRWIAHASGTSGIARWTTRDDVRVVRHDVTLRQGKRVVFRNRSVRASRIRIPKLVHSSEYQLVIRAYDARGNASPPAIRTVLTADPVPPLTPRRVRTTCTSTSIRLDWSPAVDRNDLAYYPVHFDANRRVTRPNHRTITFDDLVPGSRHRVALYATDMGNNASDAWVRVLRAKPGC